MRKPDIFKPAAVVYRPLEHNFTLKCPILYIGNGMIIVGMFNMYNIGSSVSSVIMVPT